MKTVRRSRALHNCKIREIVAVSNWQSQRNCGPVKLAKFDSVALCKLAKFNKAAACKFAKFDEVGFCKLAKFDKVASCKLAKCDKVVRCKLAKFEKLCSVKPSQRKCMVTCGVCPSLTKEMYGLC